MSGRIDMAALRKAIVGDPSRKLEVRRAWLAVVHEELEELERCRGADRAHPATKRMAEAFDNLFGGGC